jgi:hypothetical protein
MKEFTSVSFFLLILFSCPVFSQKSYQENGYFITLQGDTVHGYLYNKESMYLIYKNEKGKRKQFTPSKIKGFRINDKDYIPLYLKEFNTKRYMVVMERGYYTLVYFEDIDKYGNGSMGMGGIAGAGLAGASMGALKAHNSGYYLKKSNDDNYYSIPYKQKLLIRFLQTHFADDSSIIEGASIEKSSIDSIEFIVKSYNEWHTLSESGLVH